MAQDPPAQDPAQVDAPHYCYRHPNEVTRIHCTRCGRPICPECMVPAPVGHHCPECVREAKQEFRVGPRRRARTLTSTSTTKLLLAVILAVFAVEVVRSHGGALEVGLSVNSARLGRTLVDMGAEVPGLVAAGQYWRLITAMFLHLSLLHIAFNGYALWLLGSLIEPSFGRLRFLVIFLVSGFLGNVASYTFGLEGGVGASGAIFGLLGALVAYNLRRRSSAFAQAQLRWAATLLVLNAVLALGVRQIDWRAHLGGFVAGMIAGFLLDRVQGGRAVQAAQVIGTAALVGIGVLMVVLRTSALT